MLLKDRQKKITILIVFLIALSIAVSISITKTVIEEKAELTSDELSGTYLLVDGNSKASDDVYIICNQRDQNQTFCIYDATGEIIQQGNCRSYFSNTLTLYEDDNCLGEIIYSYGKYCFLQNGIHNKLKKIADAPILP